MEDALESMEHTGGNTNTAAALRIARTRLYDGAEDRADARKVVILLTDGLSNLDVESTETEAAELKATGVEVFAIGITQYIDGDHLRAISSRPHDTHFVSVMTFEGLDAVLDKMVHRICLLPDPIEPPPGECVRTNALDSGNGIFSRSRSRVGLHSCFRVRNFVPCILSRI